LTVSANYEASRQMDDYSGPHGTQDYLNRRNEWALTPYNSPQRLSMTYAYELPLGPNKAFLPYSDWRRHLVEGWSVTAISSFSAAIRGPLSPIHNTGVISGLHVDLVPAPTQVSPDSHSGTTRPRSISRPFPPGNGPRTHPTRAIRQSEPRPVAGEAIFAGPPTTLVGAVVELPNHAD
jgi:hypothetical protein